MKFWICLIFGIINLSALSQVMLDIPLRSFFKSEQIKKGHIQSLVVYAEINEDGIGKFGGVSDDIGGANGKILEFEFDSNGNISYKRMLDDAKGDPFITFGCDNRLEYYNFDDRGELRYLYRENEDRIYQLSNEFDSNGDLVQSVAVVDDHITSNNFFKWHDGKMIEYIDLQVKDESNDFEWFFDDSGRAILLKYDDTRFSYEYEQIGDTVKTTETTKDSVGTNSIERYAYLEELEQHFTSYTYIYEGKLEVDMKVKYDAFGNAISYDLINHKENRLGRGEILEVHYRIENVYDERELLVFRKFYSTEEDEEAEILVRIERYIYDSGPLVFKFEKCEIFEGY